MTHCFHLWAPTGRKVEFTRDPNLGPDPVMHVTCSSCGSRTWITEAYWLRLPPEPNEEDVNA
ncbi:MAG: hypothetical protein VX874_15780 [Pseudomonadota bacterium]|nr:hypothetical protein [Pseudomonadota bacterium]